jgi:multiple sugar transport system substrate-binding protein
MGMADMTTMLTRMVGCVALAAAAVLAISASKAEPVILTVAVPGTNSQRAIQRTLVEKFSAEHPDITIKLDTTSTGYDDLVQRTLRGSMTGGLPDVSYYSYNRIRLLADRKLLAPLDRFIASEPAWGKMGYLPQVVDLTRVGGHVIGLAFNISVPVVFYNANIVRDAGGDPDRLPQTWEEITALASAIKKRAANRDGIYFDYFDTAGNWTFVALVNSFCGRMMAPDNKTITFDGSEGMKSLDVLASIGRSGMIDMSKAQARQAFAAGNMGMFVVAASYLDELAEAARGRFDLRVGPFPLPCAAGNLPAGGSAVTMLTKDPKKQEAAWKWMKFVTGPLGQTISVRGSGMIPTNTLAIDNEDMLGAFYRERPAYLVSAKQLPRVTEFFSFPGSNSIKISDVIRDHLREVVTLQRSPQQAMPNIVRDVQKLLPRS